MALSFPKLLAENDRFQLFMRIMQLLLFPVLLYQFTPRLRSRLFSGKATGSSHRNADEAQE